MNETDLTNIENILAGKQSVPVTISVDLGSAALLALFIFLAVFLAVTFANKISN